MLKQKIVIVDPNKKQKLVSQELFYQKTKLVGQGTFGKVYLAKHRQEGTLWGLKEVLQDRRYKNRQLGILARMGHSNIVNMREHFLKLVKQDCYLTIIMEYVPSSLNLLIKEQRKKKISFPPVMRKILIFQLFKALYYMQLTKVCHRDLKPPNILINPMTLELKICDFGSAKILEKEQNNVSYICSRYYRAPELVMNATDYGTEIDVWSAGCIIVQLLTLEPIFPGDSSQEQLIEIIKILGTPPQKYLDLYQHQKNMDYKLPKIKPNSWQIVLSKHHPEQQLVDLIDKILTYDSKNRMQPYQALIHPYFKDIVNYREQAERIPHFFSFKDLENGKNAKQIEMLQALYPMPQIILHQKKPFSLQESSKVETTPNTCHQ